MKKTVKLEQKKIEKKFITPHECPDKHVPKAHKDLDTFFRATTRALGRQSYIQSA